MEPILSLDQLDPDKVYTYADYLTWKFEERVELIKGKIFKMSAPANEHQEILGNLHLDIGGHFRHKDCIARIAPFDVRLPKAKGKKAFTVVQPDLIVICDPTKIDKRGCDGVPDFVVEILSPSNSYTDLVIKYDLYEEVGVREYWIVYPKDQIVHQFILDENAKYNRAQIFTRNGKITSAIFPELTIDLSEIFPLKDDE